MVSSHLKNSPPINYHSWYFILKIYFDYSVLNQKEKIALINLFLANIKFTTNNGFEQ